MAIMNAIHVYLILSKLNLSGGLNSTFAKSGGGFGDEVTDVLKDSIKFLISATE